MNKLEKIKNNSVDVIEVVEEENVSEETNEKKGFSFFSFWKRLSEDEQKEKFVEEEGEEEKSNLYKFLNKKTTVLAACVLVIAIAGYLNLRYSNPSKNLPEDLKLQNVGETSVSSEEIQDNETPVIENNDDYFALAVINRERVRDEAIEMLKNVADSDSTDVNSKNEAYTSMKRMATEIANEANIESLVKAKGFTECVAVISDESANIVVESSGLSINEVAQIKEIVYLESGVLPDNIKIIEKENI